MAQYRGKVAVVTGAASGIGYALVERFLAEGMRVVLADVEAAPLEQAFQKLGGAEAPILAIHTDVADAEQVENLAARTVEHFGGVDVLCNNAGVISYNHTTWEAPLETWDWVIGTNLWGLIHGLRSFVPRMLERGEGHIVNTASGAALLGVPLLGPYTATKHAVLAISEALQRELAATGSNIKVSVVCPARTATRIAESPRLWPDRLGPSQAVGSASSRLKADATSREWRNGRWQHEFNAGEEVPASFIADKVWGALETGRFLVVATEDGAAMTFSRRLGELAGRAPSETS